MTESPEQTAPSLNPWELLATFGAAVMEITWVVLLYQAMSSATASDPVWLPFGVFLMMMVITGMAARVLHNLGSSKGVERGTLLVIWIAGYLVGTNILLQSAEELTVDAFNTVLTGIGELTALIPGEIWLAIALAWVVYRAYTFGRQGVGRFAVFGFLRLGVIMFLVYGFLSLVGGRELPGVGMFTIFLFATLMALTAARVSFLGRLRGGRRNPFSRQWLGSITGAVFATVGAGFLMALLIVGRLQILVQFIVGLVITLALAPFLFIIGLFMGVQFPEIEAPAPTPEAVLPPEQEIFPNLLDNTTQQLEVLPEEIRGYVFIAAIILSIVLFLVLIWAVTAAVRRVAGNPQVEYVAKRGDLVEMVRRQAREQLRQPGDWLAGRLQARQRVQAAARIRQIYADLLELCSELDLPRPDSQTPLEFLDTLQKTLPSVNEPLNTITQAYLKVRYGELPETREEVLAVETAWEQTQRVGEIRKQSIQTKKRDDDKTKKRRERMG